VGHNACQGVSMGGWVNGGWVCSVGYLIATSGKLNLTDMSAYGRRGTFTSLMQFELTK